MLKEIGFGFLGAGGLCFLLAALFGLLMVRLTSVQQRMKLIREWAEGFIQQDTARSWRHEHFR